MEIGDLVLVNNKLTGLVLDINQFGEFVYYHTQFYEDGLSETRWIAEIFLEKLVDAGS